MAYLIIWGTKTALITGSMFQAIGKEDSKVEMYWNHVDIYCASCFWYLQMIIDSDHKGLCNPLIITVWM